MDKRGPLDFGNNGHINRNIRLALAMLEMTKPYISIDYIEPVSEGNSTLAITLDDLFDFNYEDKFPDGDAFVDDSTTSDSQNPLGMDDQQYEEWLKQLTLWNIDGLEEYLEYH